MVIMDESYLGNGGEIEKKVDYQQGVGLVLRDLQKLGNEGLL